MAAATTNNTRTTCFPCDVISVDLIAKSIESSLALNFKESACFVVSSPDLTQPPWNLAAPGLCGSPTLADVGGVENFYYSENLQTTHDMKNIAERVLGNSKESSSSLVLGPGAGCYKAIPAGCNSKTDRELIANCNMSLGDSSTNSSINNKSKYCMVDPATGHYVMGDYNRSTEVGFLANFLVSQGKPGTVLHIKAKTRTGPQNFVSSIRTGLKQQFPGKFLGLGGVFVMKAGKLHAHVMPEFPKSDLLCDEDVNKWLQFYEMSAPITCASVLVSDDVHNMGLRCEHSHFYSNHGDAGHYHYDTTPDEVEYEGYYVVCEKVCRMDPPIVSKNRAAYYK